MAVDTSPSLAIMDRIEDPLLAAHIARETTMRFLMTACEYREEPPLSVEERAALSARPPFDAERLAFDVAFGRRYRSAILERLDDASERRGIICRMLESFRGSKASELVAQAVASIRQ
jgi:hypothetical protein